MQHSALLSGSPPARHRLRALTYLAAAAVLVAGVLVTGMAGATPAHAATTGPCDIYASGGTPCVAAHSTTRALYGSYNGNLYQVRRSSDNATANIGVTGAGGYANAAAQDSFCANTTCVITVIYDQSGRGNNLTQALGGGAAPGPDNLAVATAAPVTLNGHAAYGVFIPAGTGYRDDSTNGIATGDNAEGEYAIFDGTHYNGGCCFDYGNAETNNNDDGNGTMEAIYFGNIRVWGYGSGNGPWIMADLENGLFSGQNAGFNANDPSISNRFTTAIIKGGANQWAIRGGNAQSGSLSTFYSGPRPNVSGYNPMRKQGAIILGTGGDNSRGSDGTFYEGVMTSGYPSDATENSVQANIVAAGYSAGSTNSSGGALHAVGAGQVPGRAELHHHRRHPGADLRLQRPGQPGLHPHLHRPAHRHRRRCHRLPGRQRQGHHQRHQGDHLALQRPDQPAVDPELQRHHHRRPIRTLPGRHRSLHRQRRPGPSSGPATAQTNQQWTLN